MASAVCWVSPNISSNELEVAQVEAFRSQHQMSGPQWVPLKMWGQRDGSRAHNSWSLGVTHPKDTGVLTTCQVLCGHWEDKVLPALS